MDIGFFEICLTLVVALCVLGPQRLQQVAAAMGVIVGKARKFWRELQDDMSQQEGRE